MDKVARLLDEVAQLGVTFAAESENLRISAPKGALSKELQRRIAESKVEILQRLRQASATGSSRALTRLEPDPAGDSLPFPLSDLQLGFYMADDAYMEFHVRPHYYFEFDWFDLDPAAYEFAWNKALKRHRRELCTVTSNVELKLMTTDIELRCPVYDLRNSSPDQIAARLMAVREEMQRCELPLDRWPWSDIRLSLWIENGRRKGRVHYNHNNFFIDGFGANQLLREVDEYYHNPDLRYPPLALSYRDAVLGLNRLAESEMGRTAHSYWKSRLPGLPPPPDLPQPPGLNRRCRSQLERREGELSKPVWHELKNRAASLGVTPSNAMIAAYAYVIATWSNSDHFILSQMVTRRLGDLHPDLLGMLGNFASLYPLEIRLDSRGTFIDNARSIQRQVMEDTEHLEIGGMRVLQELNRLRGSFGTAPCPFVIGSGLALKGYRKATFTVLETSQTVLDHQFFELEDGSLYYVWDLMEAFFPVGMVDAMWKAFQQLLQLLANDPNAWRQSHFELMPEQKLGERRERDDTVEDTLVSGLHVALGREAGLRADSVVLRSSLGSLSYGALEAASNALATELETAGIRKGELVPVVMDRDHEMLVAVFAILKSGAAYVPIDPSVPRERLAQLLAGVAPRFILTNARYRYGLEWPDRYTILPVLLGEFANREKSATYCGNAGISDLAYVIYTSGSTGTPKGVMMQHGAVLNTVLDINQRFKVGPADKLLGISAFTFDLSVYDIFGTIAAGACLVYPNPESAQDPTHWVELMLRENITIWNSAPALMRLCLETAERRRVQLPSLRLVMLSGDKIPLDLPEAIRRIAPQADIVSLGGATEAAIWSILYPIAEVEPTWPTIPYGYPMRNQYWYVRDRNGRGCPTWVPGELMIGGMGLAQGYWQDAEKTKDRFPMDPLTGERLYRTGDLGRYLPGGCIEWMGRLDFQVKVQGQRVELGEIEAVLGQHPAVLQAVVTLEEAKAAREPRLVAFIVPRALESVDGKQLETFLQSRLPAYMVPTVWQAIDRLPLSENGKVDRKALQATQLKAAPDAHQRTAYVAPENALERRLQAIWEQILGVSKIGVTDDFFDLGGQSFDAIRIFALIKEEFGRAHTLSDIWRARSIRELAKGMMELEQQPSVHRMVSIDLQGRGEPLYLVHPAGGSVVNYSRIGELIDRPLYGIQAKPAPERGSRRPDITDMAKDYVAELRRWQPKGPYSLGGWSSGAMIAFEMTAQLEAAGETVRQLFVLDGPAPIIRDDVPDETLLLWFLEDLALDLPVHRLHGETFIGLQPEEQLRKAAGLLSNHGAPALDVESLMPNFQVFRDVILAGNRHRPTFISSDLTVVRVEQDVIDEFSTHPNRHDSDWGWGQFTTGEVRCVRVAGTHHTFLKRPLVDNWFRLLDGMPLAIAGRA